MLRAVPFEGDQMTDKISSLLNQYERKQQQAKAVHVAEKTAEAQFLEAFNRWRVEIAQPTFEKLKGQFDAAGHEARIDMADARPSDPHRGGGAPASIGFSVLMKRATPRPYPPSSRPGVSYSAEEFTKRVRGHRSTMGDSGGMSGPIGQFALDQLTAPTIEKHVEEWFAELVHGYSS
jgi:hypothetical protein